MREYTEDPRKPFIFSTDVMKCAGLFNAGISLRIRRLSVTLNCVFCLEDEQSFLALLYRSDKTFRFIIHIKVVFVFF